MQLQIQTSLPFPKLHPPQFQHVQLTPVKDLFPSPKIIIPSQDLLSQLRQIQLTAKADYLYFTQLKKKAFEILYEEDYEAQFGLMEKGFLAFKHSIVQAKRTKMLGKKFIEKLILNNSSKKQRKQKISQAIEFYSHSLLQKIFREVFSMIKIQKKTQELHQQMRKNQTIEFIKLLKQVSRQVKKQRLQNEQTESQVNKIYEKRVYKKVFSSWFLFGLSVKLEKLRKFKALQRFIQKLIDDKKLTIQIIEKFQEDRTLKQKRLIFDHLKQTKLQSQCHDWHKYRLQKLCFNKWFNFHSYAQQQKEIDESNQIILKHFLEQKQAKQKINLKLKYFLFWKSWISIAKEQKKQTQLMKSFIQLKLKQYLERKYFYILRQNRNYEKSIRFCHKKLKRKVLEGLKKNFISESNRLENVLKFIQKRTISKYFQRIKIFNEKQTQKIYKFRLLKNWFNLTFRITIQYLEKTEKAQIYSETSLKFKALLGMKKNVEVHKKTDFFAFHLNISLPFKRWNQRFRFRKLADEREFYRMKRIFFQWKLITVRKIFSKQKEKEAKAQELFIESRIDSRKNIKQASDSILSQNHKNKYFSSIIEEQISFFKKMNQGSQSDQDDHMTKKVDYLLTKIKTKRNQNKKQMAEIYSISGFSNQRLMLVNQNLQRKEIKQTQGKLRLPTWSSYGNDYHVSVFSEDVEC